MTVPYGYGVSIRDFLGHAMTWHGGNVDGHSSMIAYLPEEDLSVVVLVNRGFVWLTEVMPALIGDVPPARGAASRAPLSGRFEDGLFNYLITPDGENMRVEIDLIGTFGFRPRRPRRVHRRAAPGHVPHPAARRRFARPVRDRLGRSAFLRETYVRE